jgi:hypothetical protein
MLPCLTTLSLPGYGLSELFHLPGLKLLLLGRSLGGKEDCYQRLQGWALFQGFAVVQGRVWEDDTLRWQSIRLMLRLKTS